MQEGEVVKLQVWKISAKLEAEKINQSGPLNFHARDPQKFKRQLFEIIFSLLNLSRLPSVALKITLTNCAFRITVNCFSTMPEDVARNITCTRLRVRPAGCGSPTHRYTKYGEYVTRPKALCVS